MYPIHVGVAPFPDLPDLTNVALDLARWDGDVGCLLDRARPGEPLIISFSFVVLRDPPLFDFFGRTKKLEAASGRPFNRILVRDSSNAWYHRGVPGLGSHVDEVAGTLRGLIDAIGPSRVITIGQSMGGYAAILFGILLDADRVVAYGPISHLDLVSSLREGDHRFLTVMESIAAAPPESGYCDLAELADRLDYRGTTHVVFGTHPGHDDGQSGNLDAVHALRLARRPSVVLHPYPEANHLVIPWLIENGQMDSLLTRLLAA